jgi:hypothetical protein
MRGAVRVSQRGIHFVSRDMVEPFQEQVMM